jgi:predicted dehydrogenase
VTTAAVIGLGPQGKRVLAALAEVGVTTVAGVDQNEQALADAPLPPGAARLRSVDELWTRVPELVCITTNGPSHAALTLAAFTAGVRRVLVEKPMGCSVAECDQMIAAAAEHGARLAVGQGRRYDPLYVWLRERIRSGAWGQLRCVWLQRPGIGLGCLGTHSFDLIRFLADRETHRVTAWVDQPVGKNPRGGRYVDPGGLVVMEFGPGVRAVVAQIEDGAGPMSIELDLTGARVRIEESAGAVDVMVRDPSVKPAPGRPAVFAFEPLPPGVSASSDLGLRIRGGLLELLGDGALEADGLSGLAAVEVLVAAHLSQRRGNLPVTLPLPADDRAEWLPVT